MQHIPHLAQQANYNWKTPKHWFKTHPLFEPGPATCKVKNNQNIKMWTNKFIFVVNTKHMRQSDCQLTHTDNFLLYQG